MSPELDRALVAKYPEIFRDRHGSIQETGMAWGFSCGDGWYTLIDTLCGLLTGTVRSLRQELERIDTALAEGRTAPYYTPEKRAADQVELDIALKKLPVAHQVKEKFGGLRFYTSNALDEDWAYIRFAEWMSYNTCETCGATRDVKQYNRSWIATRCATCAEAEGHTHALNPEE
jgi:hypothetical protein